MNIASTPNLATDCSIINHTDTSDSFPIGCTPSVVSLLLPAPPSMCPRSPSPLDPSLQRSLDLFGNGPGRLLQEDFYLDSSSKEWAPTMLAFMSTAAQPIATHPSESPAVASGVSRVRRKRRSAAVSPSARYQNNFQETPKSSSIAVGRGLRSMKGRACETITDAHGDEVRGENLTTLDPMAQKCIMAAESLLPNANAPNAAALTADSVPAMREPESPAHSPPSPSMQAINYKPIPGALFLSPYAASIANVEEAGPTSNTDKSEQQPKKSSLKRLLSPSLGSIPQAVQADTALPSPLGHPLSGPIPSAAESRLSVPGDVKIKLTSSYGASCIRTACDVAVNASDSTPNSIQANPALAHAALEQPSSFPRSPLHSPSMSVLQPHTSETFREFSKVEDANAHSGSDDSGLAKRRRSTLSPRMAIPSREGSCSHALAPESSTAISKLGGAELIGLDRCSLLTTFNEAKPVSDDNSQTNTGTQHTECHEQGERPDMQSIKPFSAWASPLSKSSIVRARCAGCDTSQSNTYLGDQNKIAKDDDDDGIVKCAYSFSEVADTPSRHIEDVTLITPQRTCSSYPCRENTKSPVIHSSANVHASTPRTTTKR